MKNISPISYALRRIFRPIARLAISKGLTFKDVQYYLKQAFVDTAERDFQIDGKRLTDSRVSLLTGLQRRDIKQILEQEALPELKQNPLHRLHSFLLSRDKNELSVDEFENLSRGLYQDIHPRTFLDELIRLNLIERDEQRIIILDQIMIDNDFDESIHIMADNLVAHINTAVSNVLGSQAQLEQAVYVKNLSEASAEILEASARKHVEKLLIALNKEAIELQRSEKGDKELRLGVYLNEKSSS